MKCHDPTAVRLTRIPFVGTFNEPNLLSREPGLNSEGASSPALTFKAMAHGDANGVALQRERLPSRASSHVSTSAGVIRMTGIA